MGFQRVEQSGFAKGQEVGVKVQCDVKVLSLTNQYNGVAIYSNGEVRTKQEPRGWFGAY